MTMTHEKSIILNIIDQNPKMGKTAVMKVVFMLQQVKKLNMGYDFSIYTYGPYSSDVTDDVDELISDGLITSTMYPYQNYIGYELNISSEGKSVIQALQQDEQVAIKDVLDFVDGKNAKELELYSTIIYVDDLYTKNGWPNEEGGIVSKVHEIKPHFDERVISGAFKELKKINYIAS